MIKIIKYQSKRETILGLFLAMTTARAQHLKESLELNKIIKNLFKGTSIFINSIGQWQEYFISANSSWILSEI